MKRRLAAILAADPLGGAVCSFDTDTRLDQCTFEENMAAGGFGGAGGAIGTQNIDFNVALGRFPAMKINRCAFIDNLTDGFGGGMYDSHNDTVFTSCRFIGNQAGSGGGYTNIGGMPTIVNSIFVDNAATGVSINSQSSGGALAFIAEEVTIVNCLFVDNHAEEFGGGIWWRTLGSLTDIRRIVNSILRGNTAGGSPNQIFVDGSEVRDPEVTFCNIEDGWTNVDCPAGFPSCNIDADPLFASPATGDFRLEAGSPCLDAGDNAVIMALTMSTDFDGIRNDIFKSLFHVIIKVTLFYGRINYRL